MVREMFNSCLLILRSPLALLLVGPLVNFSLSSEPLSVINRKKGNILCLKHENLFKIFVVFSWLVSRAHITILEAIGRSGVGHPDLATHARARNRIPVEPEVSSYGADELGGLPRVPADGGRVQWVDRRGKQRQIPLAESKIPGRNNCLRIIDARIHRGAAVALS